MKKKINLGITIFYILIMMSLYITFLFFDNHVSISKVEYAGIIACFTFVWIILINDLDIWLVRFALLFTLISDWFLVIKGDHQLLAVITFIFAQGFYAIRLWFNEDSNNRKILHIYTRVILFIALELGALIILKKNFDGLVFASLLYFSLLLINVIIAFKNTNKNILFALGLLFFLGCDIMVGLSTIEDYLAIGESSLIYKLLNAPIDLVWFFYFPSQTLLALSVLTNKKISSTISK